MKTRSSRSTILIIDSDALMLTATAAVLNISGHECHCAQDSESALKAVRTQTLDLIICDVQVDGGTGLELCRELRQEPTGRDVPVIIVSSHQLPDIVRRVHDAGGSYYLRKPFDPDVLIDLVDKALWMPHLVRSRLRHDETESPSQGQTIGKADYRNTDLRNFTKTRSNSEHGVSMP